MAFGHPSGPPASAKQVQELLSLLQAAGHGDFRDARGPLGFTQRQAAGKFTREEAEAFLDALRSDSAGADGAAAPGAVPSPRPRRATPALTRVPVEELAAELQRRGWIVVEP